MAYLFNECLTNNVDVSRSTANPKKIVIRFSTDAMLMLTDAEARKLANDLLALVGEELNPLEMPTQETARILYGIHTPEDWICFCRGFEAAERVSKLRVPA